MNEISSLNLTEYIGLIARQMRPDAKPQDLNARGYTPEQIAAAKGAAKFSPIKLLGFVFSKPFTEFNTDGTDFVMLLFNQYHQHGTLPYPGALSEQPNKIIEAFNLLKALLIEQENQERAKQEAKAKMKHGR